MLWGSHNNRLISRLASPAGFWGVTIGAMLLPASARADSFDAWQKWTTDQGCIAYTNYNSINGMETDPQPEGFVWSGECRAGALINGEGTLYLQTRYADSDGYVSRTISAYSGTMVNGFWNGNVRLAFFDVDANGKWDENLPQPVPADVANVEYRMGCPYYTIDPTREWACVPGKVTNVINIPRVSPAYYAVPRATIAGGSRNSSIAKPTNGANNRPAQATGPVLPPISFSTSEDKAFSEIAKSLQTALNESAGSAPRSTQQILDTVALKLLESYAAGQSDAFGNDYETMMAAIQQFSNQFKAKGGTGNTGEVVEMVLGFVKDSLANKKRSLALAPAAPAPSYAPQPAIQQPAPTPVAAAPRAPQPAISYASLRNMPFSQRWSVRDVGRGCKIVVPDSLLMWDDGGENINGQLSRLDWTGACDANGLANGAGALAIVSRGNYSEGRTLINGTANNGLLNGNVRIEDQENETGAWRVWSDDAGPRSYTTPYSNGCVAGEFADPNCNGAHGIAMRDNFIAGLASTTPMPVARPQPAPVYNPPSVAASSSGSRPTLTTPNLGDLLINSYPSEALRNEWQGRVGFTLTVTATGTVSQCSVTLSSGYPVLDDQTCNVMRLHGRFRPATDGSGRPIQSSYSSAIRWVLPE